MTTYLKNKVLSDNLQNVFVGLFNEEIEVKTSSYVRQPVTFTEPNEGQASNNADILFPIAGENWGPITHISIFDSEIGGNLLRKAPAEFIKTIDISSQYKIPKN